MTYWLSIAILVAPLSAFAANGPVTVTVTAKGCEPAELTVPAGETTFQIINKSTRAMEWEILSGVMVVDERENIAPGFKQRMTTDLKPGDYEMTCGLLSNPRGRLVVTSTGAPEGPVRPSATDLIGPTAEYRVFLAGEADALVKAASAHAAALNAGDKAGAAEALAAAQSRFDHLRPALADDGATFLASLTAVPADGGTERIAANAKALRTRIMSSAPTPVAMVRGAARTLTQIASADAAARDRKPAVDGVRKVIELMQPLLARADAALDGRLKADFQAVDAALQSGGEPAATAVLKTLAEDTAKLTPALGLE